MKKKKKKRFKKICGDEKMQKLALSEFAGMRGLVCGVRNKSVGRYCHKFLNDLLPYRQVSVYTRSIKLQTKIFHEQSS